MGRTGMPWESDRAGAGCVPEDSSGHAGYAVGDKVYSGTCRGTVTSMDEEKTTMGVTWSDGDGEITYPTDAQFLRRGMPWE